MGLAIVAAILIGLTLGLLGSGGAIIALPSFVYILEFSEKQAVVASLVVVAVISLLNSIQRICQRSLQVKATLWFLIPGVGGSYLGAFLGSLAEPRIQMLVFVILMLTAAFKLLLNPEAKSCGSQFATHWVLLTGIFVGIATGFVGVGGGFLIVPALILILKFDVKQAISSSVFVILFQALSAIIGYKLNSPELFDSIDWAAVSIVAVIGTVGSFAGGYLGKKLDTGLTTKLFGSFLIMISLAISISQFVA